MLYGSMILDLELLNYDIQSLALSPCVRKRQLMVFTFECSYFEKRVYYYLIVPNLNRDKSYLNMVILKINIFPARRI
jgi:hypothetical protein